MKLWRKVGSGFKSNMLILITVALYNGMKLHSQLMHLHIWYHLWAHGFEYHKIQACISKPCGVEFKLSKSWLPAFRHITQSTHDNCLVPWRIHRQNFLLKPNVDKNLWIRTISRGENWREVWIRPCRRFPQHEHFSRSRPLHCFYVFSRLTSC